MAHDIQTMAYTGKAPWHNLGNHLPEKQPIEVWAKAAGMDWRIQESTVRYDVEMPELGHQSLIMPFEDHKVLFRSDNKQPLSVVSKRYQVVQPQEVLEFYRDLTEQAGYELETAGVLKSGRKFWALARTGKEAVLKGNDVVKGYLLLATSCDGTLATTATPTTIRVVCANTLAVALNGTSTSIKVPHNTNFDAEDVKRRLGMAITGWDSFMYRMKMLSERKIKNHEAMHFFMRVLCNSDNFKTGAGLTNERALAKVQDLYNGHGRGMQVSATKDTAWGLLCAMTEYVDHERRARSNEYRLDSAWFGQGAALKQRALDHALELVA